MHTLEWLLSQAILLVPIVLALVLPPKLYPILRKEPPARLLAIGALSGQIILIWCALGFSLLVWLTNPSQSSSDNPNVCLHRPETGGA